MSIAHTPHHATRDTRHHATHDSQAATSAAPTGQRALRVVPPGPATVSPPPSTVADDLTCRTLDGRTVRYANFGPRRLNARTGVGPRPPSTPPRAATPRSIVGRGTPRKSAAHYEAARAEVARFVGARPHDHVIFTRNTTDSFNLLASALPRDTVVFVFATEHHATLLPWPRRRTVRLPVPGSLEDAEVLLRDALASVHARHRLVVLTGASNVTGEYWPVEQFARIAREHDARVAVDAAQLAPHRAIDLDALGADYLAFSGHKVYAPFGAGVLVGRGDWLDAATPYLAGGGATRSVTASGTDWTCGPARHEAGSPNVLGAVALAAACASLDRHRDAIETHEAQLARRLHAGLACIEGLTVLDLFDGAVDRAPVATFVVHGIPASLVSAALSHEHGIGVRDGRFCAHLLVDSLLEGTGERSAVRVSAGLSTAPEDLDRLLAALTDLADHGPRHAYDHVAGAGWLPQTPVDLEVPALW